MCCAFATLVLLGPRVFLFFWWLIQPVRFSTVFNTFLWPFLGFLFVPWMTLMWLIVAPGGVTGWDWLWVGLGLLADISSYSGSAYGNRDRIPGYNQM